MCASDRPRRGAWSNVVVVAPTPRARRDGARPAWIRTVLDEAAVDDIAAWVAAGGPGVAEPSLRPEVLAFRPDAE